MQSMQCSAADVADNGLMMVSGMFVSRGPDKLYDRFLKQPSDRISGEL
jgi:hypothetical protein